MSKFTEEQKTAAVSLVKGGATLKEAAELVGSSDQAVARWCKVQGVKPQYNLPISAEMRARILSEVESGHSYNSTAKLLGIATTTVADVCKKSGVVTSRKSPTRVTEELEREICEMYVRGESASGIARAHSLTLAAVYKSLRRSGYSELQGRGRLIGAAKAAEQARGCENAHRLWNLQEESRGQYILGFAASDGNVSQDIRYVTWSIHITDRHILEDIKAYLGVRAKIGFRSPRSRDGSSAQASLCVGSVKLARRLVQLGITPAKSLTVEVVPELAESRDFWRGVVDGDGYVVGNTQHRVMVTTCSASLAGQLQRFFTKCVGTEAGLYEGKTPQGRPAYQVGFQDKSRAILLSHHLYANCEIALHRKWYGALQLQTKTPSLSGLAKVDYEQAIWRAYESFGPAYPPGAERYVEGRLREYYSAPDSWIDLYGSES